MTDFERTTIRESVDEPIDPVVSRRAYVDQADATVVQPAGSRSVVREHSTANVSGWATALRAVGLVFGILQALLILRIVLLLLGAQHGNDIVALILGVTDPFVEPFRGMFRFDRVAASGSVFDVAAVVAFIGWTLIEALVIAIMRLASRRVVLEA